MLRRGQGDTNPHLLGISKATAQPRRSRQQQRYSNSGTTAPSLQTLAFVAATVLSYSYACAVVTRRHLYTHSNHDHIYFHVHFFISNTRRRTSLVFLQDMYSVHQEILMHVINHYHIYFHVCNPKVKHTSSNLILLSSTRAYSSTRSNHRIPGKTQA